MTYPFYSIFYQESQPPKFSLKYLVELLLIKKLLLKLNLKKSFHVNLI